MDEVGSRSPSEINSFHLNVNTCDLNKKRKLQADHFGLPISKHKCWDHRSTPKALTVLEDNQPIEDFISGIAKEKAEGQAIEYGSEAESAKDSNSFVGDYESVISVHGDDKFGTDISKLWPSNTPTSSVDWSSNNVKVNHFLLDDGAATGVTAADEPVYDEEDHGLYHCYNEIQAYENPDDGIIVDAEYMCYGHGIGSIEPFIDKDLDKVLYSKDIKPNSPAPSSGSWSVNQDAEAGRKPTIDQEFEQYFSMLML